MPGYGKAYKGKKPSSIEKQTEGVLKDYSVKGVNRSVQGTPSQAVNRTNKRDMEKNMSTHHKNKKLPVDMLKMPKKRMRGMA
jgi:hypothetical protein